MSTSRPGDIFQPGDILNNTYRIEGILGRGGTSEVYKARSEISGRVMAVKALRAEFASNEDFLVLMTREEDIRDIRHDAIVRYFDTQRMPDGVVYLVMDHVDGPGLDQKLLDGGMRASELMVVGQRVCEGLIAAHTRNIVHRDLSPDNIILRNDNPADAVIIDFGIAKDSNPGAETIVGNEFAGKYAYAAPEQLNGQTDPRSDIYSLGALLLSTFRGKKPDIGNNPMEVVKKKGEPLDLQGVPAPLSTLIAKMTAPDPHDRFQTAQDLLAAFKDPDSVAAPSAAPVSDDPLDDATVIAPVARARKDTAQVASTPPAAAKPPAKPASKPAKKRGALGPVVAVLALGLVGGGAYVSGALDGLIGPKYPVAEPYNMLINRAENGSVTAQGFVPSPEIEAALTAQLADMGGTADLTLATGAIPENWGAGLLSILQTATPLDEFRITVSGETALVTGLAGDAAERETVSDAFAQGFPAGFSGSANIQQGPRFLMPEAIEPLLQTNADCGPLRLAAAPPLGYGLNETITVTGRLASLNSRDVLDMTLRDLAGDRIVQLETEVLNAALCQIDAALPRAQQGGFDVKLGWGDRAGVNTDGIYRVGDNPTIDVRLPDSIAGGYLWISVVDVKGVVYHLMPNLGRSDNSVDALRAEADADGYVRVAYSVAEGTERARLAFLVDDSVVGQSKVVVLHSDQKLFENLRPVTESVASYADALKEARNMGNLIVRSLDSAVLTTVASN